MVEESKYEIVRKVEGKWFSSEKVIAYSTIEDEELLKQISEEQNIPMEQLSFRKIRDDING